MGWITRNLAKNGEDVRGIIIVNEFDEWLDYAVSVNDNILLKYYEVKFEVGDASGRVGISRQAKRTKAKSKGREGEKDKRHF